MPLNPTESLTAGASESHRIPAWQEPFQPQEAAAITQHAEVMRRASQAAWDAVGGQAGLGTTPRQQLSSVQAGLPDTAAGIQSGLNGLPATCSGPALLAPTVSHSEDVDRLPEHSDSLRSVDQPARGAS